MEAIIFILSGRGVECRPASSRRVHQLSTVMGWDVGASLTATRQEDEDVRCSAEVVSLPAA